jgi:uroporphyrinogen-III decarboxylase
MRLATERIRANLERLLDLGVGPIIRFGGAEHATPPLMSPRDFDALVVAYDAPLVELCKVRGRLVAYHCHGHLRHALRRFVEMGVDQVDPVETVPDGDITLKEARQIAGEQITITGNIQMRELHTAEPQVIEARVKDLIEQAGPQRLIISTTGTPLEKIMPQMEENYHRFIDATLRYGQV